MTRRRPKALIAAVVGSAVICCGALYGTARYCASRALSLAQTRRAYEGLHYARTAFLIWPSDKSRVGYAFALSAGRRSEEQLRARSLLEGLDFGHSRLPSLAYTLEASFQAADADNEGDLTP